MNPNPTPARSRRLTTLAIAAAQVLLPSFAHADDRLAIRLDGNAFVIRDVRVFDGERTIDRADVVVRDGRIERVGPSAADAGLPVVDGRGRTLLPGLIDAHTHTYGDARADALRFGVTTELDMFTDWHGLGEAKRQRVSLERVRQADLWSAGTLATTPGGHGTEYGLPIPTLTTAGEAPAFVDARLDEGSDYLKIILEDGSAYGRAIPTIDRPTIAALVTAAHARGRLAVAHVATEADADEAVDAGVDGLAHVFLDRPAGAAAVAAIRAHGAFVVPTLSVAATIAGAAEGTRLAADPRIAPSLSEAQTQALKAGFGPGFTRRPFLANAIESTARLHRAGVPILAGTDAGNPGTTHGATLHQELALLVQAGLTPVEALAAATALPSRTFSLGDRGRVAPGMRADLLLVDGDPTRDITATRAIVAIWKNGYLVDRTPPVAAAAAVANVDPVIADFEGGTIATRHGQNWIVTTDALFGGRSTASQSWKAGGADGSKGGMRVEGNVAAGSAFPWAGTLFMPGAAPFEPVDLSQRTTLVFKVRGDGREDVVMIFSGPAGNGLPSTARFVAGPDWTEVRIPLAQFAGVDATRVRGIAFTAGVPAGPFAFEIDDVSIR